MLWQVSRIVDDGGVGDDFLVSRITHFATTSLFLVTKQTQGAQQVMKEVWVCYAISIQNISGFSDPSLPMHRHAAAKVLPTAK